MCVASFQDLHTIDFFRSQICLGSAHYSQAGHMSYEVWSLLFKLDAV